MANEISTRFAKPANETDGEHLVGKHLTRRSMLKGSLYGLLGSVFWDGLIAEGRATPLTRPATAKHCIILFMNGGPTQTDTFDPKPNHANGGPFRAIKTSADGMLLSEKMPQLAEQGKHLTLVRSMATAEGNHSRGRYLMHTGYTPTNSVKHPSFASILSAEVGDPSFDLPNAVALNSPAFDAAFLGSEHDPFFVPNPMDGVDNLSYPVGMYPGRFRARRDMVTFLNKRFAERTTDEVLDREAIYEKADQMIHSDLTTSFELAQEPTAVREAYGMNNFGQGCLMARRLVEAGVRCVEVSLDGWDTHQDNFTSVERLLGVVDPAMATLIADLDSRDMLHETLVMWLGEFGRTPKINENDGRDHWPNGWTVALAGGGLVGGRVIGATDEAGEKIVDSPVSVEDFYHSLCGLFGVDAAKVNYSRIGRPMKIVNGGADVPGLLRSAG
jgi:hypothetical protein